MNLTDILLQQLIAGLSNGLIIALIALGYTMVYGLIELINFAHGDVMMLGGFAALTLIGVIGLPTWPLWASLPLLLIAVPLFTAMVNLGVERVAYRPLRHAPKLTALVTAIGVSFVLVNIGLFWGGLPVAGMSAASAAAPKDIPDLIGNRNLLGDDAAILLTSKDALVAGVTIPLMLLLTWFVRGTRAGKAMRAVAQDPVAARLMGIDVDRVIAQAFAIGGALAGVAAVVFALYNNTISFQMGFRAGLDAFTAAVLGGIGSLPGAVLGGVLIGLTRSMSDQFLAAQWTNALVFGVLIGVLVLRPSGLLGARVREKV
jgi:branched-chain amino acid transport system permease protein